MSDTHEQLATMTPDQAAAYAMDNDLSDLLDRAEVVHGRRPAKMVTALRIDLATQTELEAAAAARGIGVSTLMRQIIEEWVETHRDTPPADQVSELVRLLDAARRAVDSLTQRAA